MKIAKYCLLLLLVIVVTESNAQHISGPYRLYDTNIDEYYLYKVDSFYWVEFSVDTFDILNYISANKIYKDWDREHIFKEDSATILSIFDTLVKSIQPVYTYCFDTPFSVQRFDSCIRVVNQYLFTPTIPPGDNALTNYLQTIGATIEENNQIYAYIKLPLGLNTITTSMYIVENYLADFAWPEEHVTIKFGSIPTDPFYTKQWYLKNTGQVINYGQYGLAGADINIEPAWEITKGDPNLIIEVIDDGVSTDHPDIPASIMLPGYNNAYGYFTECNKLVNNTYKELDPSLPVMDDENDASPNKAMHSAHGFAVAGIISAQHNNIGIAGIAPLCKLAPQRIINPDNLPGMRALSLRESSYAYALYRTLSGGASVLNCSWNYGPNNSGGKQETALTYVIKELINKGRNGKGTVVVFCAGNENRDCRYPGFAAITVGASNRFDVKAEYSNNGEALDLVAPSGDMPPTNQPKEGMNASIWTCDIPAAFGYNPWMRNYGGNFDDLTVLDTIPKTGTNYLDYTALMNGTSASAPQVAGVAALMLSINPCLSAGEVENILKRNATKIGGYNYNRPAANWSAARPGHSLEVGYGKLNAHASLVDVYYQQDVTYSSNYNLKAGTIKVGNNVTTQKPMGNVTINTGVKVDYRAVFSVELVEGFDSGNGELNVEVIPVLTNCSGWEAFPLRPLDENQAEILNLGKVTQFKGKEILVNNAPSGELQKGIIEPKVESEIKVYPNPAKNQLNVNTTNDGKATLTTSTGLIYKQKNLKSGINTINLDNASAGIYFLTVTTNNQTQQWKIQVIP